MGDYVPRNWLRGQGCDQETRGMENGKERRMEGPSGTRRAVPSGTGKGLPLHLEVREAGAKSWQRQRRQLAKKEGCQEGSGGAPEKHRDSK